MGEAVWFFSMGEGVHHVSRDVYTRVEALFSPEPEGWSVDGYPVTRCRDAWGHTHRFLRTRTLVSYDYAAYLPVLRERFAGADLAGEVTWHAGDNAPDRVLTAHTIGDVPSGVFCPSRPEVLRNLLESLEDHAAALGLQGWRALPEATHWSGSCHGGNPADLSRYPPMLVDMELGSTPEAWENPRAQEALARSLLEALRPRPRMVHLLCLGGVHFEPSFAEGATDRSRDLGLGHVLPNQWIVSGRYEDEDGPAKLDAAAASVQGGVDAVVYHEGLKGCYRQLCRDLGARLGVAVWKHRGMRKGQKRAEGDC